MRFVWLSLAVATSKYAQTAIKPAPHIPLPILISASPSRKRGNTFHSLRSLLDAILKDLADQRFQSARCRP